MIEYLYIEEGKVKSPPVFKLADESAFVITPSDYRVPTQLAESEIEFPAKKTIVREKEVVYEIKATLYYQRAKYVPIADHFLKLKRDLENEMSNKVNLSSNVVIYSGVSPEGLPRINRMLLDKRPYPLAEILRDLDKNISFTLNTRGLECKSDWRYCRRATATIQVREIQADKTEEIILIQEYMNKDSSIKEREDRKKEDRKVPLRIILPEK